MTNLNNNLQNQETQNSQGTNPESTQEMVFDQEDIQKNKTMAGLAYIIFFLPLIVCPNSKYAKFHANQALLLFLVALGGNIILGMIPIIGWMLIPIYAIGIFVFCIMGLINGFNGKAKRLPIFGKFDLLK